MDKKTIICNDKKIITKVLEYKNAAETKKKSEKILDELKTTFLGILKKKEVDVMEGDDYKISMQQHEGKSYFDYEAFLSDHPELTDKVQFYMKKSNPSKPFIKVYY